MNWTELNRNNSLSNQKVYNQNNVTTNYSLWWQLTYIKSMSIVDIVIYQEYVKTPKLSKTPELSCKKNNEHVEQAIWGH